MSLRDLIRLSAAESADSVPINEFDPTQPTESEYKSTHDKFPHSPLFREEESIEEETGLKPDVKSFSISVTPGRRFYGGAPRLPPTFQGQTLSATLYRNAPEVLAEYPFQSMIFTFHMV